MLKVVHLNITTFMGSLSYAEHYYGSLNGPGRERIDLQYTLSERDAARLNRRSPDYKFEAGFESGQFFDTEPMRKIAIETWRKHFPDAVILLEGTPACAEPQRCLDGPPELMARINKMHARCKELGWWEGDNEPEVRKISDEFWYDIIHEGKRD